MRLTFRPLVAWTDPRSEPASTPFKASWTSTLDLLGAEVEQLGGDAVVLQVDADETAMRIDGSIKANARVGYRGVVISFDSRHGPLRYACDRFETMWSGQMPSWQANVRAIALGLEALRKVDRYGIATSGEQYRGFTAIASSSASTDATAVMIGELIGWAPADVLAAPADAIRKAKRRAHPDAGGTSDQWHAVTEAERRLIGAR